MNYLSHSLLREDADTEDAMQQFQSWSETMSPI